MKIDVYSHGFVVTKIVGQRQERAVVQFLKTLVLYDQVPIEGSGGLTQTVATKTFASSNAAREYYRFHINLLKDFIALMDYNQIPRAELEIEQHPLLLDDSYRVDFEILKLHDPHEYQEGLISHIVDDGSNKIVTLQPGGGKAQPKDSKIKVPGGWSTMGNMKVGTMVTAKDGTPTIVTGVFPQGKVQIYKVTFADGRVVEATGEHLWRVFYNNTTKARQWRVCNTLEMKRLRSLNPRVFVELCDPEEDVDKDLGLDPWLLGILLGDGCTVNGSVMFSTPDQFILDEVAGLLPNGTEVKHASNYDYRITQGKTGGFENPITAQLRRYKVMGSRSCEKVIPDKYMEGSRRQRLAILQGLLDSDGWVEKSSSVKFASASRQLAEDVRQLVWSLGGIAHLYVKEPHYTYNGERLKGRTSYIVSIRYRKPSELFRLPRKKARTKDDGQYVSTLKLRVDSVEESRVDEALCISIDHPDKLYVTDNYVVTHNTLIGMHSMARLGVRTSAMMKGGYLDQWQATLDKSFNFGRGQLVKVQGSVYLNAIMEMALDKERLPDCMLISINTYSEYIRHFEANGVSSLYPIPPSKFFETLKIGFNIFDEGHQFVHQVMKLFTYTNIHKFLTLSGTLDTRNAFNNRMYEIMYPRPERMDGGYKNVYISVSAVYWQLKDPRSIRYTGYKGAYSHTTFEQNLLMSKNKRLLASYFDMVRSISEYEFVSKMEKGQKMILFAATEKMCVAMMKDHQKHFPHLKIAVYTSKTKAKEKAAILEDCDIIVSTLGSAGTALDIPNLRVSWVTTAVDSQQANDQCLYRTRPMIGWPDIDPRFVYSVCSTIEKHVRYHRNKMDAFRNKVKEHGIMQSPFSV